MDALALDQMLPEYEERRQDALNYVYHAEEKTAPPTSSPSSEERSPSSTRSQSSEETYESELGGGSTVPVANEVNLVQAAAVYAEKVVNLGYGSSSSNNSVKDTSITSTSIYHPSAISPTINYEREFPEQKLVAVFGRQFDLPGNIAISLQKLVSAGGHSRTPIKFVPFTLKRKTLLKGTYDSEELLAHDLVCMCYNASEARILLTGTDGFYTSLLQHTEVVLGKYCKYIYLIVRKLVSASLRTG